MLFIKKYYPEKLNGKLKLELSDYDNFIMKFSSPDYGEKKKFDSSPLLGGYNKFDTAPWYRRNALQEEKARKRAKKLKATSQAKEIEKKRHTTFNYWFTLDYNG